MRRTAIGVIGASIVGSRLDEVAERVGAAVAAAGALLVCGGLGGVMESACRGARSAGGPTLGLLPGDDARAANPFVDIAVPTGLGEARNLLIVRMASALVAIGGGYGTLSEIAFARRLGRPVVGLATWSATAGPEDPVDDPLVEAVDEPEQAVRRALTLAG